MELDKELIIVFKKMFECVGQEFDMELLEDNDWYTTYEWSVKDQDKFEKWLVEHLYYNAGARESICHVSRRNKRHLKKVAKMFTLQYGWKFKKEDS